MKQFILSAIILFLVSNVYANTIDSLSNFLDQYQMLESKYVYEGGEYSKQQSVALSLTKTLSNKELISLQSSNDILVRCYSFKQLALNNSINVITIIKQNLTSNSLLERIDGCIIYTQFLKEWYLEECFNTCNTSIKNSVLHLLSDNQLMSLLSQKMIDELPLVEKNYTIIKGAYLEGDSRYFNSFLSYSIGDNDSYILKEYNADSLKISSTKYLHFISSKRILKELSIGLLNIEDSYQFIRREYVFLALLKLEEFELIETYKDEVSYHKPLYVALNLTCSYPKLRIELEKKYPSFTSKVKESF
ncbi:hypothetical protein EI427_16780 [Flammeovirga pectinis]|uniref:Uncharacterized protein n=1 Tax=Flammeovirga pectinis TaxID=2494373 RepID=A0A3Q9FNG0_9BACT|nr:hypothetical protein [Flammeovirga pectinis]AZQ63820.1 hypothetical protein EI427_16780 [Flammeovirga pectinis]